MTHRDLFTSIRRVLPVKKERPRLEGVGAATVKRRGMNRDGYVQAISVPTDSPQTAHDRSCRQGLAIDPLPHNEMLPKDGFALSLAGIVDLHTGIIATGEDSLKLSLHSLSQQEGIE